MEEECQGRTSAAAGEEEVKNRWIESFCRARTSAISFRESQCSIEVEVRVSCQCRIVDSMVLGDVGGAAIEQFE